MHLPNNKKYLLYIKVAKTGGTSFLKYLNDLSQEIHLKPIIEFKDMNNQRQLDREPKLNDIIMVVNDNFKIFKNKYPEILKSSFVIVISRNPYQKFLSCYHYHPMCQGKTMEHMLNTRFLYNFNSFETDYKREQPKRLWNYFSLFTHLLAPQTLELLNENRDNHIADKIIRFESLNEDIQDLISELKINTKHHIKHLNKGINYQKTINDNNIITLINNIFQDDFKYLNYPIQ
jgi:hypothetical protein